MMHLQSSIASFDWWSSALFDYVMHPIIMALLCLLSVFVVLGNLLVIGAIWHEGQLHSVTNFLIASLAAADCLVGAVVMPFCIMSEIIVGSWTFGPVWCDLWHSFDVLASTASIMNLCAISLDRYLAITSPISYPSMMTNKRAAILIVSLWTCSALISFPAILWWRAVGQGPLRQVVDVESNHIYSSSSSVPIAENYTSSPIYKCEFTDDTYYLLFSSFISFYGPLSVMLYAYYRIYKAAVEQTRFLKYGSKQVVVGRKSKRPKNKSNQFKTSDKNSTQILIDGSSNLTDNHLVLRVHRGGGGSNRNKAVGTGTKDSKCSNHVDTKKSESIKSRLSFETSQNSKKACQRFETNTNSLISPKQILCDNIDLAKKRDSQANDNDSMRDQKLLKTNNGQRYSQRNGKQLVASITEKSLGVDSSVIESVVVSSCQQRIDDSQEPENGDLVESLVSSNSSTFGTNSIVSVIVKKVPLNENDSIKNQAQDHSSNHHNNALDTPNDSDTKELDFIASKKNDSVGVEPDRVQMIYYDSQKLMQSTVDLTSIQYIDCPIKDDLTIDCDVELATETDGLRSSENPTVSNEQEDINQVKGTGKKLSKLAKERKAAKTLGIVVGVFVLCWLPFFVVNIIVALCGTKCVYRFEILSSVVTWLGWLNSAMNPVIYACWSRDFRRAFKRVIFGTLPVLHQVIPR